ncbi:MAG: hypothetical protein ACRET2_09335, partial [Steroidobacteraceae bacterium]
IHAPEPRRACDDPDRWPAMSRELRGLRPTPKRARARSGTDWLTPEQRRRVRQLFEYQALAMVFDTKGCAVLDAESNTIRRMYWQQKREDAVEIRGHWLSTYSVAIK